MTRFVSLALCLSVSTVALAGDRERPGAPVHGGVAASDAASSIRGPASKFSFSVSGSGPHDPTSDGGDGLGVDAIQVDYLGGGRGALRGVHEYDFEVDGELFTVEVQNGSSSSKLSLYDEMGEVVVGYVTSDRGAHIFDRDGVVQRGRAGEIDIATIHAYGATASLLTNPVFLSSVIEANGDTFAGDDEVAGYWWIPAAYFIARCAEISVTYDSDGNWSFSAGWDC